VATWFGVVFDLQRQIHFCRHHHHHRFVHLHLLVFFGRAREACAGFFLDRLIDFRNRDQSAALAVLSVSPNSVCVVPELGAVHVAHQEVVLEAHSLECIQKKLDAVVKVWLLGGEGGSIGTQTHALVDVIPLEVGLGARKEEAHCHLDWVD